MCTGSLVTSTFETLQLRKLGNFHFKTLPHMVHNFGVGIHKARVKAGQHQLVGLKDVLLVRVICLVGS
jgi:hypothetical protein